MSETEHASYFETVLRDANDLYSKGGETEKGAWKKFYMASWPQILFWQDWLAHHYTENDEAARLCSSYPFVGELLVYLRLPPRDRIKWEKLPWLRRTVSKTSMPRPPICTSWPWHIS